MDIWHILETVVSTAFVAGCAWTAIRAKITALEVADARTDKEVSRAHTRIDDVYTHLR